MKITIVHDDQTQSVYESETLVDKTLKGRILPIASTSKEASALAILKAYLSGAKPILYDQDNTTLAQKVTSFDTSVLETIDFAAMFFTSGSTGSPTGAFKTKANIETDMEALLREFGNFSVENIVATVPFIHIYGFLAALLLPLKLNKPLLFKEHFLPHDLLACATKNSLIVTTPLYIKSLLRLNEPKDLSQTIFISSTGPLSSDIAKVFCDTFNTTLIQLFGSTETGSIAFKKQDDTFWTPFHGVEVSLNAKELLHVKSPFISHQLWQEGLVETGGAIQSFDYARIEEGKFQLLGRSNTIVKIAGKRYATTQIEEILERMEGVNKALANVKHLDSELKDEVVELFIESEREIRLKEIQYALKESLGNINIPMKLYRVEKIETSLMGKKMMPLR
ncbi:AMP-binding protein [Sulfurospirillum barnesii]|uniref:Acyl-CoA synthetase/AMP-acid ligase n=1 Tax=Sulfurospirillum barnesii (strain ATCC 700032 / DSM 10660 / SES-3) TaxID=760154 RepID=I3XZZ7_SULBS|nr:AMP-binding protein [Sulfurospirillum barnesii]AFL69521.1 acyl-CoA synthetase/AMP-acid ligase [Sulfurospirillum barnesii SES-3]